MGTLSHLDELEAEAIYIMREVAAECEKPVMLYSIGKDSSVMLHLAMKAFYPEKPPFPFMHIDTTWKFKEMIEFRDKIAKEKGIKVQHGVYIGTQGPTFETPAEYKLFHILGADAVGMSTVPEVIVANHCGIKVFGISVITDLGVEGKIVEVTHEEVQKAADAAQPKMTTIMRELINRA